MKIYSLILLSLIFGLFSISSVIAVNCGELIYFCSNNAPCCNWDNLAIDKFIQDSGCVNVTKHITSDFADLKTDALAEKYGITGVPAFVFVQDTGCTTQIGNGCSTELKEIQDGITNAKCPSNSHPIEIGSNIANSFNHSVQTIPVQTQPKLSLWDKFINWIKGWFK